METSRVRLDRAHHLVEAGRPREALSEIWAHLGTEPDDPEALALAALCHLELDEPWRAEQAASSALQAEPGWEWPFRLRSIALAELERFEEALAMAREAVRLAPQRWEPHTQFARALVGTGRAKEAQAAAAHAVELAPQESETHLTVAIVADARMRRREERAALLKALELDPENAVAQHNLAAMDVNRGRLGRGTRGLVSALNLDPQNATMRQNLDAVMTRLMSRLGTLMLLGGVAVAVLVVLEDEGSVPFYWPRALAGSVLVFLMALITWRTVRHVPAAARGYLWSMPRRSHGWSRFVVVVWTLATLAVLWLAFMPSDVTGPAMVLLGVLIRVVQVVFVVSVLTSLVRWVRART